MLRALGAAVLALPLVAVPPGTATAEVGAASAQAAPTQVTLVTGDVVAYTARPGRDSVRVVTPRPGIRYDVYDRADGWRVLPSDATEPVLSGRVDETLFNVTYLAANGYADRPDVPLILDYPTGARVATPSMATVRRALPSIDGVAVSVDKTGAPALWQSISASPTARQAAPRVVLDRVVHVDLAESVAQIAAPAAWAAGFDGAGVRVGVLDTGVDLTHPDLAGKVVDSASFLDREPDVVDRHGHGTHVASTIAGSGAAGGGTEKGVAPGAQLVVGKVLDKSGSGSESEVIAGMEWAATRAPVVSMSLGGGRPSGIDLMADAVNRLTATTGALFVIAAGNSGPGVDTVGTPGIAAAALTVGADDRDRRIASFSSRGPGVDGAVKPEVVAPGVNIVAARAAGTTMGTPVDDKYTTASGTSMATPHVAGAVAVLVQRHPDWTADQLKAAIVASTDDLGKPVNDQGAGQVDVAAAVAQSVTTAPTSLGYGELAPDAGDQTATLTYRNNGDSAVTLALSARLGDPRGGTAPDGTIELPASVTVPAGGQTEVPVVLHSGNVGRGPWQGLITATADGTTVHTPVGFTNGAVSHNVALTVAGFDGKPLSDSVFLWVLPVDRPSDGPAGYILSTGGKLRLPAGRYYMSLVYFTQMGPELLESTVVVNKPDVVVDKDVTVPFDLSATKRVRVATDEPGTESATAASVVRTGADGRPWTFNVGVGSWNANLFVAETEPVEVGGLDFQYATTVTRSQLDVTVGGVTVHPEYLTTYGGGHDVVAPKKLKMFDGRRRYDLVYVGAGTAEELAAAGDLRGRIVLAQVPDIHTGAGVEFADRAVQAGAAGLLIFDSVRATSRGDADQNEVVPVGYLQHPDGMRLVEALRDGRARADVVGRPVSPYALHLAFAHEGGIPAAPVFTARTRDMARFDTTYHADAETLYATGFSRNDLPEPPMVEPIRAPQRRAEYYGPITDQAKWTRFTGTFVGAQWELLSGPTVPLRAGSRQKDEWYGKPMRYGQSEFFNLPVSPAPYLASRQGDSVYVFPLLRDGAGHVSAMKPNGELLTQRLSRDGVPLTGISNGTVTRFDVPADRGRYQLDLAYAPGGDYRVDTSWTFVSAPGTGTAGDGHQCWDDNGPVPLDQPCQPLPLINLDYDLSGLDLPVLGYLKFRPNQTARTSLEVSYDGGRKWLRINPFPVGGGWQGALVPHPRPGQSLSLRAGARDQGGNAVTETISNAYR